MVRIAKRNVKGKTYFYLEHSIREGNKVHKHQEYLGTTIPTDIDDRKQILLRKLELETFHEPLKRIQEAYAKELKQTPVSARIIEQKKFTVKFTYDTQRIEGSTLTKKETADLLERGITPKEKPVSDVKETETHQRAFLKALNEKRDISRAYVLELHHELFKETKHDIAGKVRKHQVAIARSKFMPPTPVEVEPMLEEFFSWYTKEKKKLHPVELAALVHLKFVTIHPFADGNGRMSRLLMNLILHRNNYPLLNIPYEKRIRYYNALEKSQVKHENSPFVVWFYKRYLQEHGRYARKPLKKS
jgi:Fic family protein